MATEKMLAKGRKVNAAFMDVEKACNRMDRKAISDTLNA